MSDLYMGRVVKVHQHDHSLDIQLTYDGSQLTGVPLLAPTMTTSSGNVDMHHPEDNDWDKAGSPTRDVYVIVARTSNGYIALGFMAPQVNQMAFDRKNFKVSRHASDVYSTIDDNGNIEVAHPSGTCIRIATSPAHENLSEQDFDKLWAITRNTTKAVWVSVTVANAGSVKATLQISPAGDFTLSTTGTATVTAASLTINAPTTINGGLTVNGGGLTHNGVNVGSTHTHGGVNVGDSRTSSPS